MLIKTNSDAIFVIDLVPVDPYVSAVLSFFHCYCFKKNLTRVSNKFKVILCASEHICSIVRYCFRSFKQLLKDPLHVLTNANVLVLIDTDQAFLLTDAFRSRQTFTDQ